jgi:MFS family permease
MQEDGIVGDEQKVPGMFVKNRTTMSGLVGTGDNFWAAMYFLASTLGFLLAFALVRVYYAKPHNVVAWWYQGLLLMLCMVVGVALPGGLVVLLWHLSEKRRLEDDKWDTAASQSPRAAQQTPAGSGDGDDAVLGVSLVAMRTTRYGCRPDFQGN